jgi:hypothetical protein
MILIKSVDEFFLLVFNVLSSVDDPFPNALSVMFAKGGASKSTVTEARYGEWPSAFLFGW